MTDYEVLGLDFETYSRIDLKVAGADAYAADWSTGVHCAVFGLLDASGEVKALRWTPGCKVQLDEVHEHIRRGRPVVAHNASFETSILRYHGARLGLPVPEFWQWQDTAALAASMSLPVSLEGLGRAIGAPVTKDMEGHALMKAVCRVIESDGSWLAPRLSHAQKERLLDYCELDVRAMLSCYVRLPKPTAMERRVQQHDRQVNDRGVYLDREFALRMRQLAKARESHLADEILRSTLDLVGVNNVNALKVWLAEQGVSLPKVKKTKDGATTERVKLDRAASSKLLTTELAPHVRAVLEARVESGRATSLAKLERVDLMTVHGRLRNALRYHGAHTGRWTSGGLQLHNLPKARWPKDKKELPTQLREAVLVGDLNAAMDCAPNLMESLSWLLRSVVAAPPGRILVGGDYSAIEARVLAWLAGQSDVVQMFSRGVDVYTEDARRIGSDDRQLGKVQRLALGYGMGALKFAGQAASYGVNLPLKRAREVQLLWRKNNPAITSFWEQIEEACVTAAVKQGGTERVGFVRVLGSKKCLRIELPSGRCLHYWRPHVADAVRRIETVSEAGEVVAKEVQLRELRFFRPADDATNMELDSTYGGKLVENITQAVARDLMAEAVVRLDAAGYPVVLHVHDSACAELPQPTSTAELLTLVKRFQRVMESPPDWAPGLPIAVDPYHGLWFKG